MRTTTLLGLPSNGLNWLCKAASVFIVCLGVKLLIATHLTFSHANTKLVTTTSAHRLQALAEKLENQATIIEQQKKAYNNLKVTYQDYVNNQVDNVDLENAIEESEEVPEIEDLSQIKVEIIEEKKELANISSQ